MDFNAYIANAIKNSPIEARIVRKIVKALKDAGNPVVAVDDREEVNPVKSLQDVLDQVFNLDEAFLITKDGGWVRLTMGEGWDTICDYTLDLEAALQPVNDYIDKYGE